MGKQKSDANLEKLIIQSYDNPQFTGKVMQKYSALINPATFNRGLSIRYNEEQAINSMEGERQFKNVSPESLSFELVLDGTGALGPKATAEDVDKEIEKIRKVVYNYDGNIHETPFIEISWGSAVSFQGRCTQLDINYSLFKPNGKTLRAKLNFNFVTSVDAETEAKEKKEKSPDLTHEITVKIGDTLPYLCEKIYHDTSYYLQVARINGLVDFRNIEPGTVLTFPPLKK